ADHDSVRAARLHPVHRPGYRRGQFVRGLAAQPGSGEEFQARVGHVTRVLVLTAVDFEARTLARHLGLGRVARTPWPHFSSGALELACVGVRACRLRDRQHAFRPFDLVIAAGVCGALAPELAHGDLVVPDVVVDDGGGRWLTGRIAVL